MTVFGGRPPRDSGASVHAAASLVAVAIGAAGCALAPDKWAQFYDRSTVPDASKLVTVAAEGQARTPNRNVWHHGARDEEYPDPYWNHAESVTFHFNVSYHVPFYLGLAYATQPRIGDYNASQQLLSVIYGGQVYWEFVGEPRRAAVDLRAQYEQRSRSGAQQNAQMVELRVGWDEPAMAGLVARALSWFMPTDPRRYLRRPPHRTLAAFSGRLTTFGFDSLTWYRLPGRAGAPGDDGFFHPGRSARLGAEIDLAAVSRWPWRVSAGRTIVLPGNSFRRWQHRLTEDECLLGYRHAVSPTLTLDLAAALAHYPGAVGDSFVGRLLGALTLTIDLPERASRPSSSSRPGTWIPR